MTIEEQNRVAVYTRVSTEEQAEKGFSLAAQLDKLKAYCLSRDWVIVKEYCDSGISGRTVKKRAAYQELLDSKEQWDTLLVVKMDRIHRNIKNFMVMMEFLNKYGKNFVSVTETFDTTNAMGRAIMSIMQVIAQLESELIGERVHACMDQKAKVCECTMSRAPYGYKAIKGQYIPNKEMLDTVVNIFKWYNRGYSMHKIMQLLKKKECLTGNGLKNWHTQAVKRILINPCYAGYFHWGKHIRPTDAIEPIISEAEFNKAQKRLASWDPKRQRYKKGYGKPNLLLKKGIGYGEYKTM